MKLIQLSMTTLKVVVVYDMLMSRFPDFNIIDTDRLLAAVRRAAGDATDLSVELASLGTVRIYQQRVYTRDTEISAVSYMAVALDVPISYEELRKWMLTTGNILDPISEDHWLYEEYFG